MKKLSMALQIVSVVMMTAVMAVADVPQHLNYQGRLTDAGGSPVADGPYLIKFIIWNDPLAAAAPNEMWNSGFQSVTVTDGLFNYKLGSNAPYKDNLFTDTARWLEITVNTDPPISPRTKFSSVAYAYHALRADTARIASIVFDNSITSVKIVDGEVTVADLAFDPATETELITHQSNASDHHTKTTSASELTTGTLPDARLSINIPSLSGVNTFSADNTFNQDVKIGDSTFWANNIGIQIGNPIAPSPTYICRISRTYSTASTRYGINMQLYNNSIGDLYGAQFSAGSSGDNGGTRFGVRGIASNANTSASSLYGVHGSAGSSLKTAGTSIGVYGAAGAGTGAIARAVIGFASGTGTVHAGYFLGDVHVTGTLSKGGGAFRIDHPLDPENKYLQHSFVESPDMMNIYNGNVTTDGKGFANVNLPDYFESLNRDFRYQLTVMGEFAQAIIADEISGSQFSIRTDKPFIKVSWQVTGVRQDKWAEANRIQVEVKKDGNEISRYMHPKAFNQPIERHVDYENMKEVLEKDEVN